MTPSNSTDKKQRILIATLELLSGYGFHGFSMKQLARQADVATGTIYLYFKDRDTLISDLYRMIVEDFADSVFANLDDALPIKQQYLQLCRNIWDFCIKHRHATLSKGQFEHLPIDVLQSRHADAWSSSLSPLLTFYQKGRQAKQLKPLPDEVIASLILEPIIHIATQQLLGLIDISEDELHQVIEATWDAIAIPDAGEGVSK